MISWLRMNIDIIEITGVWVGSIGTVAAICFAFWQLKTDRDRQHGIEEKKQANLIAAWEDEEEKEVPQSHTSIQSPMGRNKIVTRDLPIEKLFIKKTGIYIINQSELPIYDVILCVSIQYESPSLEEMLKYIDEIHTPTNLAEYYEYFEYIIPGKHNKTFKDYEPICSMNTKAHIYIFFTDINGNEWCRSSRGKLYSAPNYLSNVIMPR
ncbi:hypothetical protein SDC9_81997 [bioreactor metagenome]|uniref:Uncharacterized protein n=1 Tax=bioreactor metagenome TaxID=1076179 RepID=A0A644Z3B8_9ZZZZ|nr:hypothetical protein [Erysipelotrichaceae bacterium]